MDIQNTDEVVQFVENVVEEEIISEIATELETMPYWQLKHMLQENDCDTVSILACKMFNIYKDHLRKQGG